MAKFTLDSGDPEVDHLMGDIKRDFGEAAAEGKPEGKLTLDEPIPQKFTLDQPAYPGPSTPEAQVRTLTSPGPQPKQGWWKDYLKPHLTGEELLDPKLAMSALTFGLAGGAMAGIPGAIAGAASTYLTAEGQKREYEKFKSMGYDDEEAATSAALSTMVLSLVPGLVNPTAIRPPMRFATPPPEVESGGVPLSLTEEGKGRFLRRGGPEVPPISELAKQQQDEVLLKALEAPGRVPEPIPAPGLYEAGPIRPQLEKLPTESIVRPRPDEGALIPGRTKGPASALSELPTGSLVRRAKPGKEGAQIPYTGPEVEPTIPPLPGEKWPVTKPSAGFLRSAEEMVRERAGLRELPDLTDLEQSHRMFDTAQQMRASQYEAEKVAAEWYLQVEREKAMARFLEQRNKGVPLDQMPTLDLELTGQGTTNFYDSLIGSSATTDAKVPGIAVRASTDMFRELGNSGEVGRLIELQLYEMASKPERLLDKWIRRKLVPIFERWMGRAGWYKRSNPLYLEHTTTEFKMTEDDVRQFVNYAYTMSGRYGKILEPTNPKVKGLVDKLFTDGMLDIENHPGVRQAKIKTLEGDIPVGEPGQGFYPHNPISPQLKEGLTGKVLNIAYEQAKAKGWKGYTYFDPIKREIIHNDSIAGFKRWLDEHPNNSFRRFNGLELGRTFDATLGGTAEPYKVLKDLGYGVDPINDIMHWALGSLRRGEQILAEPALMQNWSILHDQLVVNGYSTDWLDKMLQRVTGRDIEMVDKMFNDFATKVNNIANLGLLKLSGLQQGLQASYILQKFGMRATVRGLLGLPGPQRDQILHESGARVATYLQMMTKPTDVFGRGLQRQLQVIGMTNADMMLRESAALAADQYIRDQVRWMSHPAVKRSEVLTKFFQKQVPGLLREANFPEAEIKEVMEKGMLTLDQRLRYAQMGANTTQGRIGFRGQPSFIADMLGPGGRMWRNLKNFMFSNWVEDMRTFNEARKLGVPGPTIAKRVVQGIVGSVAVGDVINTLTHAAKDALLQQDTPRTPKWMTDMLGDTGGRLAGDLAAGKGHIVAAMLLASTDSLYDFMAQTALPAAYSLAARDFDKLVILWSKGDWEQALNLVSRYVYGGNIVQPPKKGSGLPSIPSPSRE